MMMEGSQRRSKRITTRIDYKALSEGPKIPHRTRKQQGKVSWSTSTFFPIEILDEDVVNDIPHVLVHYVDWDDHYNEWKPLGEILRIPNEYIFSNPEGTSLFYLQLATTIKENLHIHRKTDSLVVIRLPIQRESFEEIKRCGHCNLQNWYELSKLSDLNDQLGISWHFRVINQNRDFAFIVDGTVRYRLLEKRPLIEFEPANGHPIYKHRGYLLVFKFVRDRGNALTLVNFMDHN